MIKVCAFRDMRLLPISIEYLSRLNFESHVCKEAHRYRVGHCLPDSVVDGVLCLRRAALKPRRASSDARPS